MAKKKTAKGTRRKSAPTKRKAAAKAQAKARNKSKAKKTAARKTVKKATAKKAPPKKKAAPKKKSSARKATAKKSTSLPRRSSAPKQRAKAGGSGREETLAQTPETGRTVRGRTNPMPTKRSTGTPAGAGSTRRAPGLERARKQLREIEETVEGPPSSLDMNRSSSAARSGRQKMKDSIEEHHETGPVMTGGDVDANWEDAYAVGDEAPGGDNPTPDQDIVDDIGKALGVEYQDSEELRGSDKVAKRDKHRWDLDPASAEDYKDR